MTINESTAAALAAGKSPDEWKQATQKAATLAEALPWLKKYHGRTIVVKSRWVLKRDFRNDDSEIFEINQVCR